MRNAYNISVRKLEGKSPTEILRFRREENNKIVLEKKQGANRWILSN
jgi:hypothetical protein